MVKSKFKQKIANDAAKYIKKYGWGSFMFQTIAVLIVYVFLAAIIGFIFILVVWGLIALAMNSPIAFIIVLLGILLITVGPYLLGKWALKNSDELS